MRTNFIQALADQFASDKFAPSALWFLVSIPGALPQAVTFRAFGADYEDIEVSQVC